MPSKLLLFLFLLAACFAAFAHGVGGEFLNFDDNLTVLGNPVFRLSLGDGLRTLLTERIVDAYLPVSYLSLWADWSLVGANPTLFHVHSLLLHALAGFVLVLLMLDLGVPTLAALAGGLVFVLHPALAESATWVSGRKDVLSGLFVMLALWRGWRASRGRGGAWPVWLFALLACYAKATAVVLPLLGLGLWRVGGDLVEAKFWRTWAPVAVICLLAGVHHAVIAAVAGTAEFAGDAAAVPGTFLHYLQQVVWPVDLAVHHPRWLLATFAEGAPVKLLWLAILVTLALVLVVRQRGPLRLAGIGLLLTFVALLPFNGWRPAFAIAAADRYLYLALPCVGLAVAGLLAALPAPLRRASAALACVCLTLGFGFLTSARAQAFTRSDRLWEASLEVYPNDAVALANLAEWHLTAAEGGGVSEARPLLVRAAREATMVVHRMRIVAQQLRCALSDGDLGEARRIATEAVALADDLATDRVRERIELRLQLVSLLERLDLGDIAEPVSGAEPVPDADRVLEEILELDAHEPHALGRKAARLLASAAARAKRLPLALGMPELIEAKKILDAVQASDRAGESPEPVVAAAEYQRLIGRTSRAFAALEKWRGAPREAIFLQRARIYGSEGLLDEAVRTLERGLRAPTVSIRLPLRLAALYAQLPVPRLAEAEALLRNLYDSQPSHPKVRSAYGQALTARARQMAGRRPVREWAPLVARARELGSDSPRLLLLEARVFAASQRLDAALACARRAHKAMSGGGLSNGGPASDLILDLLKQKGYRLLLVGKRDAAFRCFRDVIEQAPASYDKRSVQETLANEFRARKQAGTKALLANELKAAEASLRGALTLSPHDEGARLMLGMTLLKDARHAEALASFTQSMRDAERHGADPGMALLYRMKALDELERPQDAVSLADAYLDGAQQRKLLDVGLRERIRGLAEKLRDE